MREMTSVERIAGLLRRKPVDRIGVGETFWGDTQKVWTKQGHIAEGESLLEHLNFDIQACAPGTLVAKLDFEPEVVEETEETILVAHNAAFDMRMLELKESQTGIKFINPVLDTLLLAAVVHPAQENQNLEAIARRLGISIVGRHTALGDALATAEVFLKFIPLLAQQGIHTLKEARVASQKTMYARLKY